MYGKSKMGHGLAIWGSSRFDADATMPSHQARTSRALIDKVAGCFGRVLRAILGVRGGNRHISCTQGTGVDGALPHTAPYHSLPLAPTAASSQIRCLRLVPRTLRESIPNTYNRAPCSLNIAGSLNLGTADSSISSPPQSACEGLEHYSGIR